MDNPIYTDQEYTVLPLKYKDFNNAIVPKNWTLSDREQKYLDSIRITKEVQVAGIRHR